jgi:M6 family metalloprotease-like protein
LNKSITLPLDTMNKIGIIIFWGLIFSLLSMCSRPGSPSQTDSEVQPEQTLSSQDTTGSPDQIRPKLPPEQVLSSQDTGQPSEDVPFLQAQSGVMTDDYPGATVRFPVTGDVNALIVFVQRKEDRYEDCRTLTGFNELNEPLFNDGIPYDRCANRPGRTDSRTPGGLQSFTDNPLAEWPANLPDSSVRGFRQLPAWAPGIIDPPGSGQITFGSLTDLYNRYSNGTYNFRGKVWPWTYIPEHNAKWYEDNRGDLPNGLARLNTEVIRFVDEHHQAIGFDIGPETFDRYTNGRGEIMEPDGQFDMIIIVYRFNAFDVIMTRHSGASAISHLGGVGGRGLTLGGMTISDDPHPGSWWEKSSGVVANGFSQKMVMTVIMHEIGHRHFGGYHTNEKNLGLANTDAYSLMGYANNHTFSGPDRIKLNWANVAELDINQIPFNDFAEVTLHDGNKVNSGNEILWIRNGNDVATGDVIIEARLQTSFMDLDSADLGHDGDGKDYSLPGNGLYIYKAHSIRGRSVHRYSSLQNGPLPGRRKYFGINDSDVVFGEGAKLLPSTRFPFRLPPSNGLDEQLEINRIHIDEDAGTVTFRVVRHEPETGGDM